MLRRVTGATASTIYRGGVSTVRNASAARDAQPEDARVIVITGATGVLGPAVAAAFAARSGRLALIARDDGELQRLAAGLRGGPARHLTIAADLGSAEQALAAADQVRERFGRADVLLHLVGTYRGGGFTETESADWQFLFQVNLWTAVCTFGAFLPLLEEGDGGRLIAVSSPYAQAPSGTNVAYAASKAALEALVQSLGAELKGRVTANLIVVRSIRSEPPAEASAGEPRSWTTPEEIAAAMLWLASAEAAMVTGARVPMYAGAAGA